MPVTVVVRSASPGRRPAPGQAAEDAPSLTFDGARVVIGRGPGSDVRLPDPSVSVRHASIRATGSEYSLVDEGSTNGTWVGGVKLFPHTPRVVKSGDILRVGRVWLEVSIGQKAPTADLGLATRELALALVRNAMDAVGDDTVAKVRIAEGPDLGAELRLLEEARVYLLGRAEHTDLPLADEDASREHVAIVRRGSQVLVRDMNSRNGVFLGETQLKPDRDTVWKSPAILRVGRSLLALDEPVTMALAELEAAADERLPDEPPPALPSDPVEAPKTQASGVAPPRSARSPEPGVPQSLSPASLPAGPVAPIAEVAPIAPKASRKRGWTGADVLVVTIALVVIGASVAGLVWVLR